MFSCLILFLLILQTLPVSSLQCCGECLIFHLCSRYFYFPIQYVLLLTEVFFILSLAVFQDFGLGFDLFQRQEKIFAHFYLRFYSSIFCFIFFVSFQRIYQLSCLKHFSTNSVGRYFLFFFFQFQLINISSFFDIFITGVFNGKISCICFLIQNTVYFNTCFQSLSYNLGISFISLSLIPLM